MDPKPLWLLAELTYKCPLQCPYCSNPLDFAGARFKPELSTDEWCRVFREAKALGVLQLGLSGGEPTLRADLEALVREAHGLGLYTSLITSAYRLTKERLAALKAAGLDHVQISIQGADAELSDEVAGTASYGDKIAAYRYTRELGFPLTVNVVLHRRNLHQVAALIELAESLGAERIELANTQFYGWALHNRDALMPTKAQLDAAWRVVQRARATRDEARDRVGAPRLPRAVSQAVHGRLGARVRDRHARGGGLAVPRGGSDHNAHVRERARAPARVDLGALGRVHPVPGRRLDARALPVVSAQDPGLRRLPLPGVPGGGRRGRYRSRVLAVAPSPLDRRRGRDGGARGGGRRVDLSRGAGIARARREGMTAAAIRARGLGKDFGALRALDRLDLEVAEGEFFGLLGQI